ncbi:MAG: xanthine dehydrogenase family protein subunit M [Pseudonocardiaceae bacterium]|nr:xanthine dehydrogenase family protein subunit M [Pseudonocardiaceae bacterium]
MKPGRFEYLRAAGVAEAVRALVEAGGDGKLLAGGQSLVPLLSMRLSRPAVVVDINRIPDLAGIDGTDGTAPSVLRVGAMTRHAALVEQRSHPLLAEAARWIGHAAIRSRGTLGGSLAHADPAAELPAVAVATGAVAHVTGPDGERTVAADGLFDGPLMTALQEYEVLTAVDLPVPSRWGFAELARRHGDFALVLAVVAEVDGRWRIAVGGVAGTPQRLACAEALLNGDGATPAEVAEAAATEVRPGSDVHAPARYRQAITGELVRRALARADAEVMS